MKKTIIYLLMLCSIHAISQPADAIKFEVPPITFGENQNYQVLSFEPVSNDKFSILYMQDLPASVVGDKEFRNPKYDGAYTDEKTEKFVKNSNRVIFLVRQTVSKTGESSTNFWVVAIRELLGDMTYTMYYPDKFVHPIIKNEVPVTYSLKNVDQIKGLTDREFEALVLVGKQMYGFYTYPTPPAIAREASLAENLKLLATGFKELKAVLGKGDIPKEEKLLFKREIAENVRLAATKLDKKDSVEIKLYVANGGDGATYDLLKAQTFLGSTNPGFATSLVYDQSLKVAGAYGYVLLKYKDATGVAKANFLVLGLDEAGDGHFWTIEAGKNGLNSFLPYYSYVNNDGLYIISRNNEKIFKPYYQHHLLKHDNSAVTLYPTNETEMGSEKREYMYTEQEKKPVTPGSTQYSTTGKEDYPAGLYQVGKSRFAITGAKMVNNNGSAVVTTYGSLNVVRIDADGKIKEGYDVQENLNGAEPVYPRLLGHYADKAYFSVSYPNKFKLILSEGKVEQEALENAVYRLVYKADKDWVSSNQFGSMLITKSIVGNKYTLQFFPK